MVTSWTDVSKASGTSYTDVPKPLPTTSVMGFTGGEPIGLLLALTYSYEAVVNTDIWSDVSKPGSLIWSNVPKAT